MNSQYGTTETTDLATLYHSEDFIQPFLEIRENGKYQNKSSWETALKKKVEIHFKNHLQKRGEHVSGFKDSIFQSFINTQMGQINTKNVITVLRQLVRLYGFSISSREKYIKGDKFIIYQLNPTENRKYQPVTISTRKDNENNCIVTFD